MSGIENTTVEGSSVIALTVEGTSVEGGGGSGPTPPGPTTDPYWANVVLLLPFDEGNGSMATNDLSGFAHTVFEIGLAALSDTKIQFGASSAYMDGTNGDGWDISGGQEFEFGAGDFTVEGWINASNVSGTRYAIIKDGSTLNWRLYVSGGALVFVASANGSTNAITMVVPGVIFTDNWYHVAITREFNTFRLFLDGVIVDTQTPASFAIFSDTSSPIEIGQRLGNSGTDFDGYIDEVRVTKGIARYTANFAVPTEAFPTAGPTPVPPTGTTQFLASWSGADAATSYTEESANAAVATFNPPSGARLKTDQFVSAPSSLQTSATGYVSFPAIGAYDLGGNDFLIETSFRTATVPADGAGRYVMNQSITTPLAQRAWGIGFNNPPTSLITFFYNISAMQRPFVVFPNTWYRVTVQRIGNALTMSVNGMQLGATEDVTSLVIVPTPQLLRFGGLWNGSAIGNTLNGWIDDTQIVIG